MDLLKSIGGIANGWGKFVVALVAVGWFGLQAVDRIVTDQDQQEVSTPAPDADMYVSTKTETQGAGTEESTYTSMPVTNSTAPPTSFGKITNEIKSGATTLFGMLPTQLSLALLTGIALGLFGRPGFDWIVEKRRIASARKRMRLYERDQQLLAKAASINHSAGDVAGETLSLIHI